MGRVQIRRHHPWENVTRPLSVLAVGALVACGPRVSRIDPGTVVDLSGRWNATDATVVANAMITQALNGPWIYDYQEAHGGERPTIVVGQVVNRTTEHIDMTVFLAQLETAFINSGEVRVVAGEREREALRTEREDQQQRATEDTRRALYRERGADYMLTGQLASIVDRDGGRQLIYYQANLSMVDLESNERVWSGQHRIAKEVTRSRFRP